MPGEIKWNVQYVKKKCGNIHKLGMCTGVLHLIVMVLGNDL